MGDEATPNGILRQSAKWACAAVLLLILYACSIVQARTAILWLDHWGMISYAPVNNALNKFYAPVLWMDDNIPVVNDAGMAVYTKTRSLRP